MNELVYIPKRIKFSDNTHITFYVGIPRENFDLFLIKKTERISKVSNMVKSLGKRLDVVNDKTPNVIRIKWQDEYLDALNELIDLCEGK